MAFHALPAVVGRDEEVGQSVASLGVECEVPACVHQAFLQANHKNHNALYGVRDSKYSVNLAFSIIIMRCLWGVSP